MCRTASQKGETERSQVKWQREAEIFLLRGRARGRKGRLTRYARRNSENEVRNLANSLSVRVILDLAVWPSMSIVATS